MISEYWKAGTLWPFLVTFSLLTVVHLKVPMPMLVADRFVPGLGWAEIFLAAIYASWVFMHMKDVRQVDKWRKNTWLLFTFIFFSQLVLGLVADKRFLMTGKLHLPVPAIILAGPLYRMQLSFMPILFLSTVLLTGPAWCSQLCYFGSLDNLAASGKKGRKEPLLRKGLIKHTLFFVFISVALLFHLFHVPGHWATLAGLAAGIVGLFIILIFSRRRDKMVHCTLYCPVGTLVNYFRYVSPFRLRITDTCTSCMACTLKCRYDALNPENIRKRRPGITCTLCGECLAACHGQSIEYRFMRMSPERARTLFLILTISLHACFLVLARI